MTYLPIGNLQKEHYDLKPKHHWGFEETEACGLIYDMVAFPKGQVSSVPSCN